MELYKLEEENNSIIITKPYYDEKYEIDIRYLEKLYYRRISKNRFRFSKNEIVENDMYDFFKDLKTMDDYSFFFDKYGDLVRETI
jgi:hypothetical protein